MSFVYLPASVAGRLPQSGCSASERSAMSSGINTALVCSRPESEMDYSTMPQYGTTQERSMADHGVERWISLLPDSHASRSRRLESKWQTLMSETSGQTRFASLERRAPSGSCWKTYQVCFLESMDTLALFSGTWPRQGTMLAGKCYQQKTLAQTTREKGYGLWPTPTKSDGMGGPHGHRGGGMNLRTAVQKFPTPKARDWKGQTQRGMHAPMDGLCNILGVTGGQLNPEFSGWLMAYPEGWTDLKALEMGKFRQWLRSFGNCSLVNLTTYSTPIEEATDGDGFGC